MTWEIHLLRVIAISSHLMTLGTTYVITVNKLCFEIFVQLVLLVPLEQLYFRKSEKRALCFKSETPGKGTSFGILGQACLSKVDESEHDGQQGKQALAYDLLSIVPGLLA